MNVALMAGKAELTKPTIGTNNYWVVPMLERRERAYADS